MSVSVVAGPRNHFCHNSLTVLAVNLKGDDMLEGVACNMKRCSPVILTLKKL